MDDNTDVIQGTLDMLVLKTLSLGPLHGFGVGRRIEEVSHGVFKANPGSLFVACYRLERGGFIGCEWRKSATARKAKYYSITRAGHRKLAAETQLWARRVTAVARLLNADC